MQIEHIYMSKLVDCQRHFSPLKQHACTNIAEDPSDNTCQNRIKKEQQP